MRARNIKPGFFKNEILSECHPLARILFEGLWCLADREGRLEDRPKRIKADVLPYDDKPGVESLLNELASKRDQDGKPAFILRYSVNGAKYIQIIHFLAHQNPHQREPESTVPAPDEHSANPVLEIEHRTSTVLAPDKHGTGPAESPIPYPESPSLNPESPIHAPQGGNELFEQFWSAYPKKKAKGDAERAWKKIKGPSEVLQKILRALEWQKVSDEWVHDFGKYIPFPATYLNKCRWDDEPNLNLLSGKVSEKTAKSIHNLNAWMEGQEVEEQEKIQ